MGNFGTFQFCALKLGNVPNLYAQKLIVPKYCQGLKKVYKFGKVPNLNAQIRQVAKFVRTNLAHCQICTLLQGRGKKVYKFGTLPNLCAQFWHFARFVRGPLLNFYFLIIFASVLVVVHMYESDTEPCGHMFLLHCGNATLRLSFRNWGLASREFKNWTLKLK